MTGEADGLFAKRVSVEQVEEGFDFAPKFDSEGLLPVITTDAKTHEVLMLGYMNKEALARTIETGEAHYWSRSRKKLWHKGEASGFTQKIHDMRIDDDQDALWLQVHVKGGASCHAGYRSCFYRSLAKKPQQPLRLTFREKEKVFDPKQVYGDAPNPTRL